MAVDYEVPGPSLAEVADKQYAYQGTTANMAGPSRDWVIEQLFTYHAPNPAQQKQLQTIRETAKFMAKTILANTPAGADQTAAIRKLRECVMTVNASIVLNGQSL